MTKQITFCLLYWIIFFVYKKLYN